MDYSNYYSFGMKQLEDNYGKLSGQMVRVDEVALPQWAENRHHYILMNYLALEHPKTRGAINTWIDLIFGEKQQKHEALNLFKPLACEVRDETCVNNHGSKRCGQGNSRRTSWSRRT